jgi:ferredoxin
MRIGRPGKQRPDATLKIDAAACDGVGICSHLAPDLVTVDPWGYPILPNEALDQRDQRQAQRAVAGCPKKALFLDRSSR